MKGWDKARLEEAGIGWLVVLHWDFAHLLDADAAGGLLAGLALFSLVTPDGDSLTERGEDARRAALRLLAERQVSPARIEALAPVRPSGDPHRLRAELDAAGLRAPEDRELAAVAAGYDLNDPVVHSAVNTPPETGEAAGYFAALVTLAAWTCITGRPEDAARAFAGLLGAAGAGDGRGGGRMKWAIKWRSDGDWLRETVVSGHDLAFIWTESKGKRFLFDSKEEAFKVRRRHQMGYARGTNGKRLLAVVRVPA